MSSSDNVIASSTVVTGTYKVSDAIVSENGGDIVVTDAVDVIISRY